MPDVPARPSAGDLTLELLQRFHQEGVECVFVGCQAKDLLDKSMLRKLRDQI